MMSLLPFWAPNMSVALLSMQGQKALDFIKNILICVPKDVRKSYRFGTTLGWVIKDRIFWAQFFGGWTTPFKISRFMFMHYLTFFVIIYEIYQQYQQFLWETCLLFQCMLFEHLMLINHEH